MAQIIPFKGILYNPLKIENMADVVTPPYDVISEQEQHNFHKRHPQNIIRLILGEKTDTDSEKNTSHTRAAAYYKDWLTQEILVQDSSPAFYLSSVEFNVNNKPSTRYGLIALVGLEPFEKGIILPHERTFSKVKSERLELMKASHANFSPIFSLYKDEKDILSVLKDSVKETPPDMDPADGKGHVHKLWRITDTDTHEYVQNAMKQTRLFIADGHHRYETALNYKDWVANNDPNFSEQHPANYVMMYLCSMQDPGMIILPAHRILKDIPKTDMNLFIQKAEEYFDITPISFSEQDRQKALGEFLDSLKSSASKNSIGVFLNNQSIFYLLKLKPDTMEKKFGHTLPDALKSLDVTVLTQLIFLEILGFSKERLDDKQLIAYSSSAEEAVSLVEPGRYDMAFILNPTRIEQVRNVAGEGLIMPRKSTYFYPKVITGQVINPLTP
ncbi:MAG: DUF1015 domain-containing protein [Deltaproteobacteria bacterium]|nr:DUF1015 domain-containing protein [Deltaproteobacteria bacterium]